MIDLIQFHRNHNNDWNKGWDGVKRENLFLLLEWIKKGEVDAVLSKTITQKEARSIGKEGFLLIPARICTPTSTRRIFKIKKIGK